MTENGATHRNKKMTWPILWSNTGTVQNFKPNKTFRDGNDSTPENFSVYVNSANNFTSNLPKFKIKNVQDKFLTFDNPYFVACCASYSTTYLWGISTKHFEDKTNNLISSIAKYHFYYHMTRLLRSPDKIKTTYDR